MVSAGMTLAEACRAIEAMLAAAGCPDAAFDAGDLCLLVTGEAVHRAAPTRVIDQAEADALQAVAARRAKREPLQYIWGQWPFLNFELKVGQGVLCPRADTEIVTEFAARCCLAAARGQAALPLGDVLSAPLVVPSPRVGSQPAADPVQVLELCGGSGCIGLGIKMFCPAAQVTVLEKSAEALPYLRENANHALDEIAAQWAAGAGAKTDMSDGVNARAAAARCGDFTAPYLKVVEGDLFAYHASLPDAAFDLLVSNPPYLTASEMGQLQPEVANEPAMALAAGQDGLDFYRAIARDYQRVVKPGGFLVLEIGCAQAGDVMALLAAEGWQEITCKQDYGKNDRCIVAKRVSEPKQSRV